MLRGRCRRLGWTLESRTCERNRHRVAKRLESRVWHRVEDADGSTASVISLNPNSPPAPHTRIRWNRARLHRIPTCHPGRRRRRTPLSGVQRHAPVPRPEVPPSSVGVPGATDAATPVSGEQRIPWDALLTPPPTDGPGSSNPERSVGAPSAVVEPERSAWSPTDERVVEDPRSIDDGSIRADSVLSSAPSPSTPPRPGARPHGSRIESGLDVRNSSDVRGANGRRYAHGGLVGRRSPRRRPGRADRRRRGGRLSAGPPECNRAATDDRRLRLGCRDRRRADR